MEKSMNYIEKLSEEELKRFCNFITGKVIRKYFQDNPKKFKEINFPALIRKSNPMLSPGKPAT